MAAQDAGSTDSNLYQSLCAGAPRPAQRSTVPTTAMGVGQPSAYQRHIRRARGPGAEVAVNIAGSADDHVASNTQLVQPVLWSPVPCRTVNLVD